jgi:hypothetical protein
MRELESSLQQFGESLLKTQLVRPAAAPYFVRYVRRFLTRPARVRSAAQVSGSASARSSTGVGVEVLRDLRNLRGLDGASGSLWRIARNGAQKMVEIDWAAKASA